VPKEESVYNWSPGWLLLVHPWVNHVTADLTASRG